MKQDQAPFRQTDQNAGPIFRGGFSRPVGRRGGLATLVAARLLAG